LGLLKNYINRKLFQVSIILIFVNTNRIGKKIKITLRGLCRHPWAASTEISRFEGINRPTVISSRSKLFGAGFFKRYYIPQYQRLGFPFISFSKLSDKSSQQMNAEQILNRMKGKTIIPFYVQDHINSFLLAYHDSLDSFMKFKKKCGNDYSLEVFDFKGSKEIVNFNFTNIINRIYFPNDFDSFKPVIPKKTIYEFKKEKDYQTYKILIKNPSTEISHLPNLIELHRFTIAKIKNNLKKKGLIERTTIINLEKIGISLIVFLKFSVINRKAGAINSINRRLKPFYYWIFKDHHFLLCGFINYREYIQSRKLLDQEIKIEPTSTQLFDLSTNDLKFNFDHI
jgi:hypothetical protein